MASQYHHLVNKHGCEGLRIIRISSSNMNEYLASEVLCLPFVEKKTPKSAVVCKDLICLYYSEDEYVLWNPFTNECKIIPLSNIEFPACDRRRPHRTCSRSSSSFVFGLGFDAESGDFKLAKYTCILYSGERNIHSVFKQISVYSLQHNSWKEIPFDESYDMGGEDLISLDGVCYWIADKHVIKAFNLATEEFSTFPIPDIILVSNTLTYLIEFERSLAFVISSWSGDAKCFKFWIMEVVDGEVVWHRKDKFDVCGFGAWNPLGFCKNGYSFLFQGRDGTLREYDYMTRKMKIIEEIFDYPLCMNLYSCLENTVQLDDNDERRKSERKKKAKEEQRRSEWSLIPHKRK